MTELLNQQTNIMTLQLLRQRSDFVDQQSLHRLLRGLLAMVDRRLPM
jgi:hypothetical protein